jgi:hypothetical protein
MKDENGRELTKKELHMEFGTFITAFCSGQDKVFRFPG